MGIVFGRSPVYYISVASLPYPLFLPSFPPCSCTSCREKYSLYHQPILSPRAAKLFPADTPAFLPLGVRLAALAPLLDEPPPVLGAGAGELDGAGASEEGAGASEEGAGAGESEVAAWVG